jgi:hypothetical protein
VPPDHRQIARKTNHASIGSVGQETWGSPGTDILVAPVNRLCGSGSPRTPGLPILTVGVEHHPGDLPAADRDRHAQGAPGQLGVVVGIHPEPDDPPGMQVQDTGQIQRPLLVGNVGQVTNPDLVRLIPQGEIPADQVGALRADRSALVVPRRHFARATRPSSRISTATVFFDTRHPSV